MIEAGSWSEALKLSAANPGVTVIYRCPSFLIETDEMEEI